VTADKRHPYWDGKEVGVSTDGREETISLSKLAKAGTIITVALHGALALAFAIVLVYVVPRFKEMFADMRIELPALTQLLITMSDACKNLWYALVLALGAVLTVDAAVFWFLAPRRSTWVYGILWFLIVTLVVGGGGAAFIVIALFQPLLVQMQSIGQGS